MNKLKKILDKTFWLYVGLGVLNYGVCNVIMLVLHHVFAVGEHESLVIEFAMQTAISFVLNRFVTFRGIPISRVWPVKFVISVAASYLIAKVLLLKVFEYLMTLPFFIGISDWLQGIVAKDADPAKFRESLVMLACTFTYCVINYIGQRYFVFKPRREKQAAQE
ncbi:MAG: GtrA family protein [Oscillospiraceae bacterium]|nr:GtrA family protein [Oscillospiraceae bacterium]